jgi:hypothetical protein
MPDGIGGEGVRGVRQPLAAVVHVASARVYADRTTESSWRSTPAGGILPHGACPCVKCLMHAQMRAGRYRGDRA